MINLQPEIKQLAEPKIMANCIMVMVQLSRFGNTRSVPIDDSKITVSGIKNAKRLKLTKTLIVSPELDEIQTLDGEIGKYIKARCLPSFIKTGVHLLPLASLDEVEAKWAMFLAEREMLIANFVSTYEMRKRESQRELQEFFSEADYPAECDLKEVFKMKRQYIEFNTAGKLEKFRPELFLEQQNELKARFAEAESKVMLLMRQSALDLVDHLVDKVTPGADGKKKVFRNTLTQNLKDFIETFNARNVTDDKELQALINQMDALMDGVDADVLRTDDATREFVRAGFTDIKKNMDAMMKDAPRRMIDLDYSE